MILKDRVAMVTGAGSGIGRAGAAIMAREGAHVVILDRDGKGGADAAAAIRSEGLRAEALPGRRHRRRGPVERGLQRLGRLGRIDILHNHAGAQVAGDLGIRRPCRLRSILGAQRARPFHGGAARHRRR